MYDQKQDRKNPVPLEKHYEIHKAVEEKIHSHLASLAHEYFVVGLRVAYDELDSSSEPGVLPYSVEFGYLGPVDLAANCGKDEQLDEEQLLEAAKNAPIPLEFLDDLLAYSKSALETEAGSGLNVGVAVVLTGSPTMGYSVSCPCNNNTRKRYCYYNPKTKTINCYCTTRQC